LVSRHPDAVDELLLGIGLQLAGGLWCDSGHRFGVARSPAGLFIGWLDVGWTTPDNPFSELRDIAHIVERVPLEHLAQDIGFALEEAAAARDEHLRDCIRCGERFVPGQMYGADCCHSCAVRDGDVRDCRRA
jgi:hypothetical protein